MLNEEYILKEGGEAAVKFYKKLLSEGKDAETAKGMTQFGFILNIQMRNEIERRFGKYRLITLYVLSILILPFWVVRSGWVLGIGETFLSFCFFILIGHFWTNLSIEMAKRKYIKSWLSTPDDIKIAKLEEEFLRQKEHITEGEGILKNQTSEDPFLKLKGIKKEDLKRVCEALLEFGLPLQFYLTIIYYKIGHS